MTNFKIIDNGLINTMSQSTTIVIHSIFALMAILGVSAIILCIICTIRGDENPILCIVATILCVFLLLFSIFAPFMIKEDNLIQTYKVKPSEDATIEDMFDFEMKYEIIAKEDDWYVAYEK